MDRDEEQIVFAQPKEAGFSFSHNINSHLARLSTVRNTIPTPDPALEEKAWCALDNWDMSATVQGQIKMSINEVWREAVSLCCSSLLQQAGVRLLIGMTVINAALAKPASDLKFPLTTEASGCADAAQVWKPLMGLWEKPGSAGQLLHAQRLLSSMSLSVRPGNRELPPGTPVS
ncbi:PREDICTED: protein ARMCX6-like [Condylura cristata]|uniref:protein ARMCX6-like n=1 Tax=Condylura cristata TaxID=143302 RepID=UPI0003342D6B|nr:PREDICTED: protein ARMCX6-like [Condylura cristata]